MSVVLTEQSIVEMAPNDKALLDARGIVRKGALRKLARSEDGLLVFGLCQGSGGSPYQVSMDLATGADRPTLRCTCPSRQFPCKHELGLMLAFVDKGKTFPVEQPPADLLDKRAKMTARAEKKAAPAAAEAPRKVDKTAQAKKAKEQGEALDTLEQFIVDLVAAGLGGLTDKHIRALVNQSKRMADADMKGAAAALQRLAAIVSGVGEGDEADVEARRGLSEAQQTRVASMITQLWVTVRRGKRALEGKAEDGTTRSQADAELESILGKRWLLPELEEAGYAIGDRRLLELAHERTDDHVTEMATATGYMLDLDDGSVVREMSILPFRVLRFEKLRPSRAGVVEVKKAVLYPGEIINRRIRWDEKLPDNANERPRALADIEAAHRHARPLDALLKALRNQLKNPLYPPEAVMLLAVQRFGALGDELVAEDAAGARLVLRDPEGAPFSTTSTLRRAAAAFGPGTLAVRLYFEPISRAVYGQGLALLADGEHLRLGT
ncbi:hypothetical protein [Polyangium aurulentum]|uniref:hypothetical protein n=1 Tax=Polyangium aurulentum TaxID=2567896 RepID=UPI00146CAAE9|nr:hypothetical protein [Polyangium aurulentum]UQA61333.1 hypothetical protein E8A73_013005 [Polyangium aurulentum]